MPSGKIHGAVTLGLTGVSLVSCSVFSLPQEITFGVISGLLIHPDLDVDKGARHLHLIRKSLGSGIAVMFHAFWRPYALDQKHRGHDLMSWQVSHFPILGTIDRVAHIFAGARLGSLAILIAIFSKRYWSLWQKTESLKLCISASN